MKGTKGGNEKPLSRLITNLQNTWFHLLQGCTFIKIFKQQNPKSVVFAKVVLKVHLNEVDDFKFVETKKVFVISRNSLLVQPTNVLKCLRVLFRLHLESE